MARSSPWWAFSTADVIRPGPFGRGADRREELIHGFMELATGQVGDQETLGQRIKRARLEKRWTQRQVARACNVETITVSRWENDKHRPGIEMLRLIARAVGQPLSYLVDEPPPLARGATSGEVADLAAEVRGLLAARDDRRLADVLDRMEETLHRLADLLAEQQMLLREDQRRR